MRDLVIRKIVAMLTAAIILTGISAAPVVGQKLVILHTNDTHSNIEPDAKGTGGILQRKAVVDSVRKVNSNVLLVDAGDMVQGSLFFKFFRGEVEYPLFNMMKYDIRVLGNHEFDNGLEDMARHYKNVKADRLSANYDFTGTAAEGLFKPYVVKKIGGKRIGFMGINVDPTSLISATNYQGMKFYPVIETADSIAKVLRNKEKCDLVVAVTHIGYRDVKDKEADMDLARNSSGIDIIIGGHSHTLIDPATPDRTPCFVPNVQGRPVLIVQTGKNGRFIGEIDIDLSALKGNPQEALEYKLLSVTDRFPAEVLDKKMQEFIKPFKTAVDSVNKRVIAVAAIDMPSGQRTGPMANFTADMAFDYGKHICDSLREAGKEFPMVDFAVMNVGGIRHDMPAGNVTEGEILSIYPFSNHIVIMREKGKDVIEALGVAAQKGGEAVSRNVRVITDATGDVVNVMLNGAPVDPDRDYTMVTIDYLAEGNDDMQGFARGRRIWTDVQEMAEPVLRYIERMGATGTPIYPDSSPRFLKVARP